MDGLTYYLQGVQPCVLLYKWKNELYHDVFRIRLIDTREVDEVQRTNWMDVSPHDLHLWATKE